MFEIASGGLAANVDEDRMLLSYSLKLTPATFSSQPRPIDMKRMKGSLLLLPRDDEEIAPVCRISDYPTLLDFIDSRNKTHGIGVGWPDRQPSPD